MEAMAFDHRLDGVVDFSNESFMYYHDMAIAKVTLCTSATIACGLAPEIAYNTSAKYMQKLGVCENVNQIIEYRNRAIADLLKQLQNTKLHGFKSRYVEICKSYIREHYTEKIYIGRIATELQLSESYLSRIFKKEVGISFQEFLVKTRVENAAFMLVNSDSSLAEIAESVNFSSQSYMGKMFIKHIGMTPKEYRKQFEK